MLRLVLRGLLAVLALACPLPATWSIILIDVRTGEIAVASATCLPNFDLAVWVPVIVVGKGAACAQSYVDPTGTTRIYIRDQLALGTSPAQILSGLAGFDTGHQSRQYGIVDLAGRAVGFTGTGAGGFASDRVGRIGDIVYAIQGNVLTGGPVLAAAELAIYSTNGDLGEKLMAAMEAARLFGGDGRCSCNETAPTSCGSPPVNFTKSADVGFMIVARPGDVDGGCNATIGCASGSYYMRLNVANRLRTDPDPVFTLRTLFDQWRLQQRGRVDQFKSTFTFGSPNLPINGLSRVTGRLELRDREGNRITTGGATVRVTLDATNTTSATIGTVVDNRDGTYDVPITAGTNAGRLVLKVTVDDGNGAREIAPKPALPTTSLRLWADRASVSAATGGRIEFAVQPGLFGGTNRIWILAASGSGTFPGLWLTPLYRLPLNPDPVFHVLLHAAAFGILPELIGVTSATGMAGTALSIPPGAWSLPIGLDLSFAFALLEPISMTSNFVTVRIAR